jgi:hypothetical protein
MDSQCGSEGWSPERHQVPRLPFRARWGYQPTARMAASFRPNPGVRGTIASGFSVPSRRVIGSATTCW